MDTYTLTGFCTVHLKLWLRTRRHKVERVLRQLDLMPPGEVGAVETCHRDPSLQVVNLTLPLAAPSAAEALYRTLELLAHLSSGWWVTTPQHFDGGRVQLNGSISEHEARPPALFAADFEVTNFSRF